jgi:hypothetical protein
VIRSLREDKEKLERVIAALEELKGDHHQGIPPSVPDTRRGRKSMSPDERQEVSARMKRYWAKRRRSVES